MKFIVKALFIAVFFPLMTAQAQNSVELFSVPLSRPSEAGRLEVAQVAGSINVVGYDGKEVVVKAIVADRESSSRTKNGLTLIANSSMNISAEEKDNTVRIINESPNRETNFEIKVPLNFSLKLSTVNDGDIFVQGVNGEMEVGNVNGEITLQGVSGSVSANTTNGDVKVVFKSITPNVGMAFSSFNGNVDVTFPSSLKASVKIKSEMGDIYTDFDMAVDKQKVVTKSGDTGNTHKVTIDQWVTGKINGGGPEMLFKTYNGDIIIRSK